MRVRLITCAIVGAMCAGLAHAETVGAPAVDAKKGSFAVAVERAKDEFQMRRNEGFNINEQAYDVELKTQSLRAAYAPMDGFLVSVRVGQVRDGKTVGSNPGGGGGAIQGTNADGDLFGIGIDSVAWQGGPLSVGVSLSYTEYQFVSDESRQTNVGRDHVDLNSTQLAAGLGYTVMSSLTAYGGVRYQRLRGNTLFVRTNGNIRNNASLKDDDPLGGYAGLRYQSPWKVVVGVEMRSKSSWSVNLGAQF